MAQLEKNFIQLNSQVSILTQKLSESDESYKKAIALLNERQQQLSAGGILPQAERNSSLPPDTGVAQGQKEESNLKQYYESTKRALVQQDQGKPQIKVPAAKAESDKAELPSAVQNDKGTAQNQGSDHSFNLLEDLQEEAPSNEMLSIDQKSDANKSPNSIGIKSMFGQGDGEVKYVFQAQKIYE